MRPRAVLTRAAVGVLLVAGAIGVVRQRREALQVRRGERGPSHAETAPAVHRSCVARMVAGWLPERPRSRPARVAAALWAAPASLFGLVVGVLGRGRARWDDEFGILVFEGTRGLPARLLRGVGAGANAIGQVVISTYDDTSRRLLAHEAMHVRQAERLGPGLLPLYALLAARYGYRDNPIEQAAREAARRWTPPEG